MNDLDKWAAKQCGVRYIKDGEILWFSNNIGRQWTLRDARCREIVREHFKIDTDYIFPYRDWMCVGQGRSGHEETIAEAEIACIEAIYEAQK